LRRRTPAEARKVRLETRPDARIPVRKEAEPRKEAAGAHAAGAQALNLDCRSHLQTPLAKRETELVERIGAAIEVGRFELPQLPATSMALMSLSGRADVEVDQVVRLVSSDPSLASELLRLSNSVVYATHVPAQTLNEAVMRIGLRGLRSLIFSVSVRGSVMRLKKLEAFSEEIWRQAFSVASIARAIAPALGMDRERAFLVGLLHDIGKIALLAMLAKETRGGDPPSPATVGRVFYVHHERAGRALASRWRLDDEIVSVAGNHHDFQSNPDFGRSAALASLAHRLELHLSYEDEDLHELTQAPELEFLGVPEEQRLGIVDLARRGKPRPAGADGDDTEAA